MKKKVKVLLCENVDNLGIVGDEVDVALGFARNFLIPKKFALSKNDPNYNKLIREIREKRKQIEKELVELKEKLEKITNEVLEFTVKAGEKGKLFGSITTEDIAEKIGIAKKYIISEPLKSLGEHKIKIKLPQGISSELIVKIIPELEEETDKKTKADKKTK